MRRHKNSAIIAPDDVQRKVVQALGFKEKCSLQVLNKGFHALLSNPMPAEGLWGRCDLMSDLKLNSNFDRKEIVMRCGLLSNQKT